MIITSLGDVTCAPSSQYTLYPLYSGGLWLAVTTIPAIHPRSLTANDNSGVGLRDGKTYALMPFAFRQSAASSANSGDILLQSYAIATPFDCPPSLIIKLASPCVAFLTVYTFILLVPLPITPLSPPVPNSSSL